jgi:hypothetical protein
VTVFDDIAITGLANNGSICTGGIWELSVNATGAPSLLYQWQDSTAQGIWQNVIEAGGTNAAFVSEPLNATTYYRVFVHATESGCEDVYSATVTVNVFDDISITALSPSGSVCQGGTWNLSVIAAGAPTLSYQWQDSTATGVWENVSEVGGTSTNFTTSPLTQTTYYRVFVFANENGCEDVYSATIAVTVFDDIDITGVSAGGNICEGGV